MSKFNVGDRRSNLMHELVYVGGSNPWRECDADGWIAAGGQIPADIETQVRGAYGVRNGCKPEDRENNSALWGPDLTHWRPASPARTPEAVRGVLRGEKAEEPAKEELKPDPVAPLSEWMQALGMLSPYAPSMEIDVSDPVSMARQIMAAIEATLPPKPPKPLTVADQALTLTPIDGRAGSWRA